MLITGEPSCLLDLIKIKDALMHPSTLSIVEQLDPFVHQPLLQPSLDFIIIVEVANSIKQLPLITSATVVAIEVADADAIVIRSRSSIAIITTTIVVINVVAVAILPSSMLVDFAFNFKMRDQETWKRDTLHTLRQHSRVLLPLRRENFEPSIVERIIAKSQEASQLIEDCSCTSFEGQSQDPLQPSSIVKDSSFVLEDKDFELKLTRHTFAQQDLGLDIATRAL